ncbi:hypothetical protein L596_007910 [Steinernema carpocapsae]|uniref:Uncharacterized protein n=1 Tax=Steinernema carpocapsae TaxID=34508 RepID=A0A4V6A658_STECR|nr:hypothetical protein L596_007910 [Steinernema carpocapsae]
MDRYQLKLKRNPWSASRGVNIRFKIECISIFHLIVLRGAPSVHSVLFVPFVFHALSCKFNKLSISKFCGRSGLCRDSSLNFPLPKLFC